MNVPWWLDDASVSVRLRRHVSGAAARAARQLRELVQSQARLVTIHGTRGPAQDAWLAALIDELAPPGAGRTITVCVSAKDLFAEGTDPWEALVLRIGAALYRDVQLQLDRSPTGVAVPSPVNPGKSILLTGTGSAGVWNDPRLPLSDVARRLSEEVPDAEWDVCFSIFGNAPSKLPGRGVTWGRGVEVTAAMIGATAKAVIEPSVEAAGGVASAIGSAVGAIAEGRSHALSPFPLQSIEFRQAFARLSGVLCPSGGGARLVVVIEDVESCSAAQQVELQRYLAWLRPVDKALLLVVGAPTPRERGAPAAVGGTPDGPVWRPTLRLYAPGLDEQARWEAVAELWWARGEEVEHAGVNTLAHALRGEEPEAFFRCLVWLWSRASLVAGPYGEGLLLLLGFYFVGEGGPPAAAINPSSCLDRLCQQPWDLGMWPDRQDCYVDGKTTLSQGDRLVLLHLRAIAVASAYRLPVEELIQQTNAMLQSWVTNLPTLQDLADPEEFARSLRSRGDRVHPYRARIVMLARAATNLGCVLPPYNGISSRIALERWWDAQSVAHHRDADVRCDAVLRFFHRSVRHELTHVPESSA